MATYFIVALIAYFLGSIPFGYILVRTFKKQDIRQSGSGNIGATNVARSGAKGLGVATLVLDAAKGFSAVEVAKAFARSDYNYIVIPKAHYGASLMVLAAVAAIFAILGHMYPVWLRFKGGKGVATGVGVFLAIAPAAVGGVLVIFIVVVWISRYVSLGSIIATASFPILAWLLYRGQTSPAVFAAMCFAAFLIIWRHRSNIQRLLSGTEHRLGEKKSEVRA